MPFCSPPSHPSANQEVPAVGVKVEGLSKNYGSLQVFKNVSFEVQPSEIFVLMGPSGSGKSVLLRQIVGLERPTAGRVTIDGHDVALEDTREHVRLGLVFQAGALFNSMTVYDNLALYLREHQMGDEASTKEKVTHALRILSLEDTARKYPSDLSGGMKKRVAIARSLVMEPQLLLYDEPTSELDPVTSASISEIIASLKDQYRVTSIVVSHDRELALNIADRIGILMAGELIFVGNADELKASKDPRIVDFLHPKIDLHHPRFKTLENATTT
jgi:phospholipid/cholesterol/gamma-HCH transport system ATP-binding protein